MHTVENDTFFMMSSVVIPIGMSEACTFIIIIDDTRVEANETRTVIVVPLNQNDMVNGSTSLLIIDNDGMQIEFNIDIHFES